MIIELRIEGSDRVHYLKGYSDEWVEYDELGNYCGFSYENVGLGISRVFSYLHEMVESDLRISYQLVDLRDTEF